MPSNFAAWLPAKCVKPLQIDPAPYTPPGAGEIVVKKRAVAINPVDWGKQEAGNIILGYINYPFIQGGDVAGDVVEVGSDVNRFRVGDRVIGQAVGAASSSNNPVEGAFQHYTVIREHLATVIPAWMSYEQACVLPLALLTAAYGLFDPGFLALDPPTVPPPSPNSIQKAIVITGGASSVGSNAIQLAVSAGYQVYSTASPKNFAYVSRLGAIRVFDYHSTTWVDDLVLELY
ncbi:chaperonin 10-like protein [Daldinia decipiens]|uniref:chaperonin 10-like protein n=1 Tax=Daldinia decipiens TaxID=326647 RepID=UPI0020C3FF15|nr:chaperonin 10-like protein [Daldinia decipiens]KAI1652383.1 chaperonin 10-like protein [Daldinia decipiens]